MTVFGPGDHGPGDHKTQKRFRFSQLSKSLDTACSEGRQRSPAPGPLGRAGELFALPCCVHRLSSAASRVFTPGNPCAGPMDSSAEEGSRAVSASTHDRAHWSQVGKGQTFETVFVESDKQILNLPKVPVGEKVYLQRDKNHGLSAITQGGSSRQNMMREMLDARWSDVQVNGRPLQTRDLIRIPDHTNFYTKPSGELVVVVDETVPRIGITDISKRPTDEQKYTCELCGEVGDGYFMRQHMAGHDDEENWDKYKTRWSLSKPDFPCGLCMVRNSRGSAPPAEAGNQMQDCYMNFAGKHETAQVDHFCKMVTVERPCICSQVQVEEEASARAMHQQTYWVPCSRLQVGGVVSLFGKAH